MSYHQHEKMKKKSVKTRLRWKMLLLHNNNHNNNEYALYFYDIKCHFHHQQALSLIHSLTFLFIHLMMLIFQPAIHANIIFLSFSMPPRHITVGVFSTHAKVKLNWKIISYRMPSHHITAESFVLFLNMFVCVYEYFFHEYDKTSD